jgi:hypothetical protein
MTANWSIMIAWVTHPAKNTVISRTYTCGLREPTGW